MPQGVTFAVKPMSKVSNSLKYLIYSLIGTAPAKVLALNMQSVPDELIESFRDVFSTKQNKPMEILHMLNKKMLPAALATALIAGAATTQADTEISANVGA